MIIISENNGRRNKLFASYSRLFLRNMRCNPANKKINPINLSNRLTFIFL